jgi:hypothetical protein
MFIIIRYKEKGKDDTGKDDTGKYEQTKYECWTK